MAQPYVTGPVLLFAGIGSGFSPLYLGTAEKTPRIQIRPSWSPVYNDLSGPSIPFDWSFDGEEGLVTCDLTRWNESVYGAISARPRESSFGTFGPPNFNNRGTSYPGDIGTLMISEGLAYPLWLLFPYMGTNANAKAYYSSGPSGYRFAAAFLEGPDELDPIGTQPNKRRLLFHCGRAYQVQNSSGGMVGLKMVLYDHDCSQLSAGLVN